MLQKNLEQTRTALAESQKLAHYWKERYESRERFLSVNLIWQPSECQYYTGLPSYVVFEGLYKAFSSAMPQVTRGPSRALRGAEEFLMVLVRLRTGMPVKEVARNFGITVSSFSKIFSKWILFLQKALRKVTRFPSLSEVRRNLPRHFSEFDDTHIVIDCTEKNDLHVAFGMLPSRRLHDYYTIATRALEQGRCEAIQTDKRHTKKIKRKNAAGACLGKCSHCAS